MTSLSSTSSPELAKLDIYDVGVYGEQERALIDPQGSHRERRGTVDLYTLNPGRTAHLPAETIGNS
jgi:hypothetical protein